MKSQISDETLNWLLEKDNPSIRYYTLKDLLDRPMSYSSVKSARKSIMTCGPVPAILAKQKEGGYWGVPQDFYVHSKFKGTVWTIIILAELGADTSDRRIRDSAEFILDNSQDRESGGFAYLSSPNGGGDHSKVIPCLTGNMVFSLIRFGLLDDPRVRYGIEWLTRYMRYNDKDGPAPKGWPYDHRDNCWGRHTCMTAVAKGLKALAEIPAGKRTPAVRSSIEKSAEYILWHHVYRRSHDPSQIAKTAWTLFGFPMWDTNALEMLGILTRLGYRNSCMQEAIDLVLSKRGVDGRWLNEKSLNKRFIIRLEPDDKPSKWVTLNALRALKPLSLSI